jgi:hypothetical protein
MISVVDWASGERCDSRSSNPRLPLPQISYGYILIVCSYVFHGSIKPYTVRSVSPAPETSTLLREAVPVARTQRDQALSRQSRRETEGEAMDWTPGLRQSVKQHCAVRCRSIVGRG